jgi:hypothetical protein
MDQIVDDPEACLCFAVILAIIVLMVIGIWVLI